MSLFLHNLRKNSTGMTLVEVLVVMGISTIITLAAGWVFITSTRTSSIVQDQLQGQNDARKVLQHVVDNVRRAEESSIGSYPIEEAGEYSLVFFANTDDDTLRERIRFWLADEELKQGVIKPTGNPLEYVVANEVVTVLARDVVNTAQGVPIFSYYGEEYTGIEAALVQPVSIPEVRVIRLQLEIERDPDKSPVPLHAESVVHVRNLKTN